MTSILQRSILILGLLGVCAFGICAKSPKRGICWDEKNVALNKRHAEQLRPGVSWVYNWGENAVSSAVYDADFTFAPMTWNGNFSVERLRSWYTAHPECRYLLGFNEPNFADQANMTPEQAVDAWSQLEALAEEFGLLLVAPALNFSASKVGGRVWNPYEWYDEFFRLYPQAHVDCLAMHCYMNWYSANTWLATKYFYSDLFNPTKDCYGRYPHLVAFLNSYKQQNGHFPRMMLTEFCSWENDGTITGPDSQIDQMTQKIQKLEQSDLVEGYAWFMANANGGFASYPYMSLFSTNSVTATLSDIGMVYVNMSDFDTDHYHAACTAFAASAYIDASTDSRQVKLRPNSDTSSEMPIQIQLPAQGYATYQIDVPAEGEYQLKLRVKAENGTTITPYIENRASESLSIAAGSIWTEVSTPITLTAGHHTLKLTNNSKPLLVNKLKLNAGEGGVADIIQDTKRLIQVYNLNGVPISNPATYHGPKIVRYSDGSVTKTMY